MTHLSPAQINVAFGKVFVAPRVIDGCSKVRFCGVFPSGNVGVKRPTDPESFGPIAISPAQAEPLLAAIGRRFTARGFRAVASLDSVAPAKV